MILIKKKVDEDQSGKKVYLLGKDKSGDYVWLEAPSWDCNWYWGFGYIERYFDNKRPSKAEDISSHSHWDSEIIGNIEGEYRHHLNTNPNIVESVLTDAESWKLAELMKSYYILKETADFFKHGGSHLSENPLKNFLLIFNKNEELTKKINEVLLPAIFKEIDELLTPKQKERKE